MEDRPPAVFSPSEFEDPLHAAASAWPEVPAVVASGRVVSYGELDRWVSATAAHLRALGGPSMRVGLLLPNGWPALVLLLATIRAGRVACPLSTRMPAQGVAASLRQVAARLLIVEDRDLARQMPAGVDVLPPEAVVQTEAVDPSPPLRLAADQPATIIFTSGSTGAQKAALLTVGNHYFSALGANENIPLAPGDRWLLVLPLYHVGGLGIVFRCLLAGAAVVIPEPGLSPGEAIARHGVTHVSLVATQLRRLLGEDRSLEGMKAMLVGGSAVPPTLVQQAHARAWPVHTTYGLTEMASQVTTTPPDATLDQLGASGRPLPYRRLKIADDGEILVKGATLFRGYVEGDALEQPFDADGWFPTNDVGRLDADGALCVTGRADNLFISGGENIQPEEIEQALCRLDGVADAVVVPVADAAFGQRPVAFVQRMAGAPPLDALGRRLDVLLPRFKIPVAFFDWPEEAASPGMKIDRSFFQRRAARQHGENRDRGVHDV